MISATLVAPRDPLSFSQPLQPSTPVQALTNPWGSFFGSCQRSDDPYDTPGAGPSCPDLDQQTSQKLMRDEWPLSAPSSGLPQTEDVHISPAAMFLAAFTPPVHSTRLPDDEGETVAGYVLGPVIGYGGFSTIRRASSPSGGVVAIKIVRRSDVARQTDPSLARKRLDHETEIWSSLSHEHILPLFSAEHTSYADFYITLLCPAGSLFDILKRDGAPGLPHDDAGMTFRQVVRGVRYLHEVAGYVHRDIKLENVLVDEMGVCRISDFGLARKIGESDDEEHLGSHDNSTVQRHRSTIHYGTIRQAKPSLSSHVSILRNGPRRHRISTPVGENSPAPVHPAHAFQPGSLPYAAPELLSPQTPGRQHGADPAQDMWAMGCLLYALLTGRLPFCDPFEPRLTMKILHGVYDMSPNIGRGASRVLKGCLERDLRSRWTIAMVDEIAWDIGYEFESADYPNQLSRIPTQLSRSCSRERESTLERPSRQPRSLSCTSATTSSSLSTRSTSRSVSRPRTTARLPLAAACDDGGHAALSASMSVSSRTPLEISGSGLLSPTFPVERGRSPKKADLRLSDCFAPSLEASTGRSDLGREPSHGCEMYSGTDALDNTARWASALRLNTITEVTTHRNGASSPAVDHLRKIRNMQCPSGASNGGKRAESTPPVSPVWSLRRSRAGVKEHSLSSRESVGAFLREPSTAPIPIVRRSGKRSRSVGYELDSSARRLL